MVIESTVSVNKMVDGAPHLFDKQIAQISTRSALGEKSSVEVAQRYALRVGCDRVE